ncbi:S41 family peptidase [Candidatus Falkowbacteria bacterium]|nr:S41 family peptidase [Candidatus Falkowbacteria bacterium]NCT54536.1 S41 family peptidase [Candidatus Falkowbacteria bacterium]
MNTLNNDFDQGYEDAKNLEEKSSCNSNYSKKIVPTLVLAVLIFAGGFYFGLNNQADPFRSVAYYGEDEVVEEEKLDFNLYWEVWDNVKTNYVDKNKIEDKDLFYGSLRGIAESTGDPYTIFMDPVETKEFSDDLAGTFEGIGAEIGLRNDITTVIAPLDDTPAQKAGLRSGDKIYAVDDAPTIGLTITEVVRKIRGEKDTKVKLTIIRGDEKPFDVEIIRGVIVVKSVKTEMRADGVYVLRLSNFNDDTELLFKQAVDDILVKQPRGIILDLRNNPGGYLDTAINIASEWIEDGVIVAEQLNNNRRNEYPARGLARLKDFKTVILVNGGSASASEILAGALRDYRKATLVGETTFGKGSVQALKPLSDGSILKVTISKWLTPAGDSIDEKGIDPNIEVELSVEDVNNDLDPQMDKALEIIKK